jgi:hypothetical protein
LNNDDGIPLPGGGTPSSSGGSGGGDWWAGNYGYNKFRVVIGKTKLTIYKKIKVDGEIKKIPIVIHRKMSANGK